MELHEHNAEAVGKIMNAFRTRKRCPAHAEIMTHVNNRMHIPKEE